MVVFPVNQHIHTITHIVNCYASDSSGNGDRNSNRIHVYVYIYTYLCMWCLSELGLLNNSLVLQMLAVMADT